MAKYITEARILYNINCIITYLLTVASLYLSQFWLIIGKIPILDMSLKISYFRLLLHLPGANELNSKSKAYTILVIVDVSLAWYSVVGTRRRSCLHNKRKTEILKRQTAIIYYTILVVFFLCEIYIYIYMCVCVCVCVRACVCAGGGGEGLAHSCTHIHSLIHIHSHLLIDSHTHWVTHSLGCVHSLWDILSFDKMHKYCWLVTSKWPYCGLILIPGNSYNAQNQIIT